MTTAITARLGAAFAAALLVTGCASNGLSMEGESQFLPSPVASDEDRAADKEDGVEESGDESRPESTIFRGNDRTVRMPEMEKGEAQVDELEGDRVSLNFERVPLRGLVQSILGDLLQVDYSIDKPIEGEATLHTGEPVPRSELIPILQSFLQANGALMVKGNDGIYHVGPAEAMRKIPRGLQRADRIEPGYSTVIIPLHYIGAGQMADILEPVAPEEAFVRVDDGRNILMLAGTRDQLRDWVQLIDTFDVDMLEGMSVGIFPLEYASVDEVGSAVSTLLNEGGEQAESLSGLVKVMPIERLNSLLVVTPRAHYLDTVEKWIERLDREPDNNFRRSLYVYPVQNGSAAHLADMLNQIFGGELDSGGGSGASDSGVAPGMATSTISDSSSDGLGGSNNRSAAGGAGSEDERDQQAGSSNTNSGMSNTSGRSNTASGSQGGGMLSGGGSSGLGGSPASVAGGSNGSDGASAVSLGDGIKVVADESNNALLIYARRTDYRDIKDALRTLDVAPAQILIEASIIEVSLNGDLRYGLQWYLQGGLGGDYDGTAQLNFSDQGDIGPSQPGFSYSIASGAGTIRAVLNALAEKSLVQVISSPSLMVLDNQTATIQVGDQQPVRSGETITSNGFVSNNIQYKDTGVSLAVTPSANAGDLVRMQVQQVVTDVGQVDSATGQRSFLQREIDSQVAVRSGQTVVLGGLIKNNASQGKSGVPFLGDIPGVGNLFSTTTRSSDRTELLVMITPRVLRDEQDLQEVTSEMRDRMSNLKRLPGWGDAEQQEAEEASRMEESVD